MAGRIFHAQAYSRFSGFWALGALGFGVFLRVQGGGWVGGAGEGRRGFKISGFGVWDFGLGVGVGRQVSGEFVQERDSFEGFNGLGFRVCGFRV